MSQLQRYLPIVESGKESKILGLIDLGSNVSFDGTETTRAYTNSADVSVPITLLKYVPTPSLTRQQNPWFMVAVFSHDDVYKKAYLSYAFVPIKNVMPAAQWSSGSGLANLLVTFDGLILRGLSQPDGFSA
jgi:hypothetical protein